LTWISGSSTYVIMILFDARELAKQTERSASYSKATNERAKWMEQTRNHERSRFENDQNLPATEWHR